MKSPDPKTVLRREARFWGAACVIIVIWLIAN
jgi:hypothetical protein